MRKSLVIQGIVRSHPTRGAWIEIGTTNLLNPLLLESHPTRGAWIEMVLMDFIRRSNNRRTLPGVRGLKYIYIIYLLGTPKSHPTRGAWIEIACVHWILHNASKSHPTRGAWIEIAGVDNISRKGALSHPTRGAWIEIPRARRARIQSIVAPYPGCVD